HAPHAASRYPQIVIKEPNTSEPKRAKRKRITPEQLKELTAVFETADTPTHDVREELSRKLGMTNREVQVWFQNRRAKYSRIRAEQQRQMRTNQAIIYGSGLLGALPLPAPVLPPASPPMPRHPPAGAYIYPHPCHQAALAAQQPPPPTAAPALHAHYLPCGAACYPLCGQGHRAATRRSTISSFSGSDGVYGGAAAAQPAPPPYLHATTDEAITTASSCSRYAPAVPAGAIHVWSAVRTASPPDAYGRYPATAVRSPAPVRLPSIQAMLAGARGEQDSCDAHASHRVRAYTSPPPAPDGLPPSESAGGGLHMAALVPDEPRRLPQPSPPQPHWQCDSGPQPHDAKMGIDVLAAAAISVSSVKTGGSLPHLTPLSEFSLPAPKPQSGGAGDDGGSNSGTSGSAGRSWRPW
ncbi:hypothetical protein H4R19_005738, partial [Coemansia spiralis]